MLVSNATNKIEIVVRKEVGLQDDTTDSSQSPMNTDGSGKTDERESARKAFIKKKVTRILTSHAYGTAMQIGGQVINFVSSGIGNISGDSAYQDLVQRKLEIVSDTMGVANAFGLNMLYGTLYSGGNVGIGLLNAGIGGISALSSKYFKYAQRHREYDYKVFKENNAIEYNRSRASLNLTTGRLR